MLESFNKGFTEGFGTKKYVYQNRLTLPSLFEVLTGLLVLNMKFKLKQNLTYKEFLFGSGLRIKVKLRYPTTKLTVPISRILDKYTTLMSLPD